jgi:hypothetical protein
VILRGLALIACLFCPVATPEVQAQDAAARGSSAVLRGLDKVSGKTVDVQIVAGGTAQVFDLWVALAECRYPANNPTGDAFAYLRINQEGGQSLLFEGWMVASSPALNALDHARYDVWVLRCNSA